MGGRLQANVTDTVDVNVFFEQVAGKNTAASRVFGTGVGFGFGGGDLGSWPDLHVSQEGLGYGAAGTARGTVDSANAAPRRGCSPPSDIHQHLAAIQQRPATVPIVMVGLDAGGVQRITTAR